MISELPKVNAILNSMSALLLLTGFFFIRRRNITAHKVCMISAFFTSTLFLVSYLTYHAHVGNVRFMGQGWLRPTYFAILISHTLLAIVIVPLAITTLRYALLGNFAKHKPIAKITFPLWLYVSVTGVIVYWMLFHL